MQLQCLFKIIKILTKKLVTLWASSFWDENQQITTLLSSFNTLRQQFPPKPISIPINPNRSLLTQINSHLINFTRHFYTVRFCLESCFCMVSVLHRCHFSTSYIYFMTALCTKRSVCMASIFYWCHILR